MRSNEQSRPGDGLVRAGAVIFVLGLVAILLAVLPFFFGLENRPLALNVAAGVLPPLGLGLALSGLVRAGRAARRLRLEAGGRVIAQR